MLSVIVQSKNSQIISDTQHSCRRMGFDCHPTLGPIESQEKLDQLNPDWPIAFITDSSKPLVSSLKNPERLCVLTIDGDGSGAQRFSKKKNNSEIAEWTLTLNSWSSLSCNIYLELAQAHLELRKVKSMYDSYRNSAEQFRVNQEHLIHESKNTLFILQGRCEALRESLATPSSTDPWVQEISDHVESVVKVSDRLMKIGRSITEQLLKSRNQRYKDSKEPMTKVNIHGLIQTSIDEVSLTFDSHVQIKNEVPTNLELNLLNNKMLQVANNLFLNSYNAIKKMKSPWITVKAEQNRDSTVIMFLDSGNGIKNSEKIFKPHYSTNKGKLSQGLGLKIAKRYLAEMDAKIYYRLYDMKYTCMVVEFAKGTQDGVKLSST